jgi:deoxyribonuclease-4
VEEIRRADAMGAEFFITHVGHHKGKGQEYGIKRVSGALNKIIAQAAPRLLILLENTADEGKSVGESFDQIKAIIGGVKRPEKLGVCLDTCHSFAHGYDVAHSKGLDSLVEEIDRLVGLSRLRCVHLNDSAHVLGSHRDRHEHIGKGRIGEEGFRFILRHPVIREVPGILETPIDDPGDDVRNLATIRRLAEPQTLV